MATNNKMNQNEQAEQTRLDLDQNETTGHSKTAQAATGQPATKKVNKKQVAMGALGGMVVGAAAVGLMSFETMGEPETPAPTPGNSDLHNLVDDEVDFATGVNDEMSFGEAFAAARAEVGPGGVFEWRGKLYGTYYAEEWNNMTPEERAEYNSHFAWSSSNEDAANVAEQQEQNDVEVEVVSTNGEEPPVEVVEPTDAETPEVEVVVVAHDPTTNTNGAVVTVGGEPVVLLDVNDDHIFDGLAADANHDGEISENEIVEISGENITVEDLGGFTTDMNGSAEMDDLSGMDDMSGMDGMIV